MTSVEKVDNCFPLESEITSVGVGLVTSKDSNSTISFEKQFWRTYIAVARMKMASPIVTLMTSDIGGSFDASSLAYVRISMMLRVTILLIMFFMI